ncbi:hypothetical protein PROVRUST_05334 [Providencia rustigianii DSM 4541]|uniref:Uncharacterized protein n=1 Tax=Providencia rustigianii DSM 4541 TaxID=500637 RepID=D1NZI0_9GAMM|nr:hypothetical protein PROVRUST_05334 [Providencia rustigianii DSM 4541]
MNVRLVKQSDFPLRNLIFSRCYYLMPLGNLMTESAYNFGVIYRLQVKNSVVG